MLLTVLLVREDGTTTFAPEMGVPVELGPHAFLANLVRPESLVACLALRPVAVVVHVISVVIIIVKLVLALAFIHLCRFAALIAVVKVTSLLMKDKGEKDVSLPMDH